MATVTFDHVNKSYGDVHVVKDFNLEIGDGEFMVLVGPSGCGKTTSLRMIAGLEEITSGELRIGDRVVNDVPPKDRDIAMVFQSYALYPHMSVRENLAFGLKLRKVPKAEIERRVNEAAETIQLQKLLDRKPKELSGGQRQRVALGRAIVREPAVFLMDEPLSNLDAQLRVQTREELLRLHARLQTTTIYVTHDQIEAMTMGHRIVVMRGGLVQQVGPPQEVYDHPANTFVAAFLGSPRINLHPGALDRSGETVIFRAADIAIPLPGRLNHLARTNGVADEAAFGIRPEDIRVTIDAAFGANGAAVLPATIALVEPVGSDLFITANTGDLAWTARAEARLPVSPGQRIGLHLNLERAHLFGSDGRNVSSLS